MGLSGEKAQNKQADTMLTTTNTAIDRASAEDEALREMRAYWKSIIDWDTGKMIDPATGQPKPINVRDLPGSGADISLFENAKGVKDAGRVGRGFGTVGDNVNPAFTAALDKEMENERSIAASGMLEDVVQNKVADARGGLTGIGMHGDQRNANVAGLRSNLYSTYLNRPRNPSLLSQFLGGASQAFSGFAGSEAGAAALLAI